MSILKCNWQSYHGFFRLISFSVLDIEYPSDYRQFTQSNNLDIKIRKSDGIANGIDQVLKEGDFDLTIIGASHE